MPLFKLAPKTHVPKIDEIGFPLPSQCDWAWRPEAWKRALSKQRATGVASGTSLGEGIELFHDCPLRQITVAQRKAPTKLSPFRIALKVDAFEGNFFSLVFHLPEAAQATMTRHHIVSMAGRFEGDLTVQAFARLNVQHGPNIERMQAAISPQDGTFLAELDLGAAMMKDKVVAHAWIDIIFEQPANTSIIFDDLVLLRTPRAEL